MYEATQLCADAVLDQVSGLLTWENESPTMNAATPGRKPMTEEISGLIERVTFHNEENGFCVLRVKTPGHREETTVIGSLPSVTAGEWMVAKGWWIRDKEHGLQFKATMTKTMPPTTVAGIERYLSSGLVKGIDSVLAKKLVGRFGAEVLGKSQPPFLQWLRGTQRLWKLEVGRGTHYPR